MKRLGHIYSQALQPVRSKMSIANTQDMDPLRKERASSQASGLWNKNKLTCNVFDHAAGIFEPNRDNTHEVYEMFNVFKQSRDYDTIINTVIGAPAFQTFVDKAQAHEEASFLNKEKLVRLKGLVTTKW